MKKRTPIIIAIGVIALVGGWFAFGQGNRGAEEVEFRYAAAENGELTRSISATGQLVPLTTVDIRSRAGGTVDELLVDLGSEVKRGDLIALIDPRDTQTSYDQAEADLTSASARADQARVNLTLETLNSQTAVENAQANLRSAELRLETSQIQANRQPTLTRATIANAQAALQTAQQDQRKLLEVDIPQRRREAQVNLDSTRTAFETADANYKRLAQLKEQGFVSGSQLDQARTSLVSARASFEAAQQRVNTLENNIQADVRNAELAVVRSRTALDQAQANRTEDVISQKTLAEQRQAVVEARLALKQAIDNRKNVAVRRSDVVAAQASTVRNRVQVRNAKVQLDSTRVEAPREGVVVQKYIEEGTVIPPGTSTFSQGTAIVQLADVTRLFVDCAVDEADVAQVKLSQEVRIITEAFPSETVMGKVVRINPAATTLQNVTAVTVRVEVLPGYKPRILPGMNATCEFITLAKKDVLIVPSQAIRREGEESYVLVKGTDPKKPEKRVVNIGETGNDGVEILSGIEAGAEVVIAEINLNEMRDLQKRMQEAQQGGGLAGGAPGGGRGGGGGGGRVGGGGGGGGARPR